MRDTVVQLEAADFDEAIAFLDLVFGEHRPHDFVNMLPGVYQPTDEHMRCNYAVKRDGRIVAITGLFPIDLRVGHAALKTAGIGGVGVHPDCRGRGLMRRVMDRVLDECRRQGYHLSYLGGHRQRYRYWGWERGGAALRFRVRSANIRHHIVDTEAPAIGLADAAEDAATMAALRALHERQPIHCRRPAESFGGYLRSWHRRAIVARDQSGTIVGYCCAKAGDDLVIELCARDDDAAVSVIRQCVLREDRALNFMLPALPTLLARRIGAFADETALVESGNWQVFDWPRTVDAFLKLRHAADPLPDGSVTIGVGDRDVTIRLSVDGDSATCTATDDAPDFVADANTMIRVLFGPLSPAQTLALPHAAAILHAWCPLPLGFSVQDYV